MHTDPHLPPHAYTLPLRQLVSCDHQVLYGTQDCACHVPRRYARQQARLNTIATVWCWAVLCAAVGTVGAMLLSLWLGR